MAEEIRENSNFIHDFIDKDLEDGVYSSIQTRFPPEPNGYLHIGHAKAICINFGVKEKYKGVCNLRLDDTNPTKEDTEYVDAIKEDIQWLGFQWDNLYYASDYFDFLFDCAIKLIKKGKAFVCELTPEEMRMLVDVAKAHDLFIIGDEAYREFVYAGEPLQSLGQFPDAAENVIVTPEHFMLVAIVGGILLVAAVLVSSISTLRLKPKQILAQME